MLNSVTAQFLQRLECCVLMQLTLFMSCDNLRSYSTHQLKCLLCWLQVDLSVTFLVLIKRKKKKRLGNYSCKLGYRLTKACAILPRDLEQSIAFKTDLRNFSLQELRHFWTTEDISESSNMV